MSLLRVKFLHKRRILVLITILSLASILFSTTAYSFLGFYNGFTSYVGEEKDILAVYSKLGNTPFTGIVPVAAANHIATIEGVIAVSPEAFAPCVINNQSVFVRGVLPQELKKLNNITITSGENIELNDANYALTGKNLAQRLNLKTDQKIVVFSVMSQKYVELTIKGIFTSDSPLDDEILVPLYVAQWLRGLTYNDATLIRTKIDLTQTNQNLIFNALKNISEPTTPTSPKPTETPRFDTLIPITQPGINIQNIGVEESQKFMSSYLSRYGISKDTLVVLSVAVLFFAGGTAAAAITLFVKQHNSDIDILRSIGVTKRKIKLNLIAHMAAWALAATVIGTATSAAIMFGFQEVGYLQVLSHSLKFQLDPLIPAANFAVLTVLAAVNIVRAEFKP